VNYSRLDLSRAALLCVALFFMQAVGLLEWPRLMSVM
jgi:hypothetical protein